MSKIELTPEEVKITERMLQEDLSPFNATDEEHELMSSVLEKMEKLIDELQAYEESGGEPLKWFYEKYKAQEGGN